MTLPPVPQPPDGADLPGEPVDALAGMTPDIVGLDVAALADREEPTEAELAGICLDSDDCGDGANEWLAVATAQSEGFAEGGVLDGLGPGGALAGLSQHALDDGLTALTDDAVVGLIRAARRLSAWQSGIELAAVAELDQRRLRESRRPGWSRVSEHIAAELAAALILTGRSADSLLGLARDLARLPAVRQALLAGRIDRARALVFAAELSALSDQAANAAAAALLPEAPSLTTGQLRNALRTLVHCIDPAAVRRRMTKARDDARVEAWQEGSGNFALAGRELAPSDAIAADRRITAIARALQAAGASDSLDQLRAAVFTALLAGRDPGALAPNRTRTRTPPQHRAGTPPGRPRRANAAPPAILSAADLAADLAPARRVRGTGRLGAHHLAGEHLARPGRPAGRSGGTRPDRRLDRPRPGRPPDRGRSQGSLVRHPDQVRRNSRRPCLRPGRARPSWRPRRPPPLACPAEIHLAG